MLLPPTLAPDAAGDAPPGAGPTSRLPLLAALRWQWHYPRWNFSRHAATFRAADAFVVSIQKSGRTWVRVFLRAYFAEWKKSHAAPDAAALPALVYSHDLWEHQAKRNPYERLRGKWLIPCGEVRRKPVLLVARDPRDAVVSLFFHLHRRACNYQGDLPALLRHPVYGIERVVEIMNRWLDEWSPHTRLHLLRYEDARHDPAAAFAGALRFLLPGLALDAAALERATHIASFENMRRLEAGDLDAPGGELLGDLRRDALRPRDADDPDSFKVRRGKVGGYADYLSTADLRYVDRALRHLHPRYGYGPTGGFSTETVPCSPAEGLFPSFTPGCAGSSLARNAGPAPGPRCA